ncbi:response regulator [Natronococcus pandeyae]|uniref:Response regulator n=1 Tax=Natronococcus pandeyae TaxID=2055836 RepID=A0A8J8PZK9_9EURY|nr:response regulator [Natronococcus pandeyae]TYL36297.1 response regulator [Natronococcus pandeyae]
MKDGVTDSSGQGRVDLPSDGLFDVLSASVRRTVLFHLRQHRAATVDELVDVIVEIDDSTGSNHDDVNASLFHNHLPKLVDKGLVTFDPERRIVESRNLHGEIGEWLDLAVRHQIRFESALETADGAGENGDIRVLLVDDEPGLPEAIGSYIERENDEITVATATSALEAVTTLEDETFDCIVSDYQMPAISGLDFLKVVREQDDAIPFIVFTAKGSETVASQAITTGVTDYVQKGPTSDRYDELADRIRKVVTGE